MVCWELKLGTAGWLVQMNPLSYGGTPAYLLSKDASTKLCKLILKSSELRFTKLMFRKSYLPITHHPIPLIARSV